MADILEKILATKRSEVAAASAALPLAALRAQTEAAPATRDFLGAIQRRLAANQPAIIAEIKRASPSKGLLREPFEPAMIAASYEAGGAACLSVLTDREYFQGGPDHLRAARAACALPVLRKDFIVDEYQVWEARAWGADCVLLIVAALDDARLRDLEALALGLGMSVLVEIHDRAELDRALALKTPLVGINNRDLRNFVTRLEVTLDLRSAIPADRIVVTESGIRSAEDVRRMRAAGVHAFLVGETFMRAPDPGAALRGLVEG